MSSSSGFRMTCQRQVILEELKKAKTHPTADQVYELVRQRLPRISLGTVYRNLENLFEQGLIQKLDLAGTPRRFDGEVGNHYHVRCLKCGRVEDVALEAELISALAEARHGGTEYQITGHRLEFTGFCPQCCPKGFPSLEGNQENHTD